MAFDLDTFGRQLEDGVLDPMIFLDEEIYALELERVWRRSWVFLGHETMIAKPGDYITTFLGEDPVILTRDGKGRIRAFLNRCRHKGVKLCPFDRGSAKMFSCVYHGWVFGNDGSLVEVPEQQVGYGENFEKSLWGLIEVPQVASYGGFIFGNWDAGAISLDDYLGDMRYYFDHGFGRLDSGGIEMSPLKQRSLTHHNWKLAAENASDMYHIAGSHAGAIVGVDGITPYLNFSMADTNYAAIIHDGQPNLPSHSVLSAEVLADPKAYDLQIAGRFGQESVDYIERRYAKDSGNARLARGAFISAGVFPSLTLVDLGPISVGVAIELYHPKAVRETETWLYIYVEKDAPKDLKTFAAQEATRFHSLTGSIVPADHENWERLDAGIGSPASRRVPLNFTLGMNGAGGSPAFAAGGYDTLPGQGQYGMSERGARSYYRHWARMMQEA